MYIPTHFQETDPAQIAAIMDGAPLACIVAQTKQGLVANHIPLFAAPDGALIGHVAAANDLHRILPDGSEVLAIFRGVDGYVSANDYPSKSEHHRMVPTWNYTAVHIHGAITWQHNDHAKRAAVALLTRLHERRVNGDQAWRMADAPADYLNDMLAAIVAFRITPTRVLAKSKLSQNRDDRDYQGVIDGARRRGDDDLADAMQALR
ncbi:FMN-binding negative transcriptional regulator [Paracoccus sp. (in: a-proteobacteria)]|uniref:FMN-binding negative transcriptional regulator n=1 Tax=Paracoccus sp. TaxID=267 RepID=UPI0026DF0F19|nr:FMN-binding negative transcriptional regulator [Paracoccus sp. (in: a-proteobacteria)]MDO5647999.1 FMN-binding negative transcriptional regulator [Paracoccus sp. (in: a-proteobacteria)]